MAQGELDSGFDCTLERQEVDKVQNTKELPMQI
jgi:hypothetical protein